MAKSKKASKVVEEQPVVQDSLPETVEAILAAIDGNPAPVQDEQPVQKSGAVRVYEATKKEFRVLNAAGAEVLNIFNLRDWCRQQHIKYTALYYTLRSGNPCKAGYLLQRNFDFIPNATCLCRKPRHRSGESMEDFSQRMEAYNIQKAALAPVVAE